MSFHRRNKLVMRPASKHNDRINRDVSRTTHSEQCFNILRGFAGALPRSTSAGAGATSDDESLPISARSRFFSHGITDGSKPAA